MARMLGSLAEVVLLIWGVIVGFLLGFAVCFWLFASEKIKINKAPRVEILKP